MLTSCQLGRKSGDFQLIWKMFEVLIGFHNVWYILGGFWISEPSVAPIDFDNIPDDLQIARRRARLAIGAVQWPHPTAGTSGAWDFPPLLEGRGFKNKTFSRCDCVTFLVLFFEAIDSDRGFRNHPMPHAELWKVIWSTPKWAFSTGRKVSLGRKLIADCA